MDSISPSSEVVYEVPMLFQVYKDGRVERYRKHDFVPPSDNPVTGVRSKDIVIVPENNVTVRLYLPKITQNDQKFPLLVYFHGGAFVIESAFSTYYDSYLHSVAAETNVLAVSVEYRLAPEHKIPACYDDSWAVMKWISQHANGEQGTEPWLKSHADFSRVFLSGDSAGANIAHNMMMRASVDEDKFGDSLNLVGMALIHPYFGTALSHPCFGNNEPDRIWSHCCPESPKADDPRFNPAAHPSLLPKLGCSKILICTSTATKFSAMAEIVHDFFPLIRVYKDGRIERMTGEGLVPAESDPETGVQIKDIEIDPEINVSARLYLPQNIDPVQKIPLFVYFHGGGFVVESASSPTYHKHLSMVAAEAKVVIVSVNYRLAPEYPLPIAYEDSWVAFKWVASHANGDGHEPWLKDHADFNRVYFGGDSAGGNIAHNIAIRVGSEKLEGMKLDGIFLACPFFWGKDPIDGEGENLGAKDYVEKLWLFVNPNSSGLDDPLINPEKDPRLSNLGCEKVLLYVAGKDPLRYRGFYYKTALEKNGWPGTVEVVEIKDEEHVFHLFAPKTENAMGMLKKLASFLNQS